MGRHKLAALLCVLVILATPTHAEKATWDVLILKQSGFGASGSGFSKAAKSFRSTLTSAMPVRVYLENLEFKYFSGPAYEQVVENYLKAKYRNVPIDVLVTLGPRIFEFGLKMRSERWPGAPLVAAAADRDAFAKAAADAVELNLTGRAVLLSLGQAVNVARTLVPGLKQIALVGDPLEKQAFRRHFLDELPELKKSVAVLDLTGLPLEEVKQRVAALPSDSAVIYTAVTSDGAGRDLSSYEALEVIAPASKQPIIVDIDNRLGHGGTGGSVVQPALVGEEAAELVQRILNGQTVAQIPVTPSAAIKLAFDWRELHRLGISESVLPPDSAILFQQPTIWEQHQWWIVFAVTASVLQTALIIGLFYEDRRRRVAEDSTHSLLTELERSNRVATAGELAASIAHEVRQPLTSIVVAAEAGLNWMARKIPDLEEVRSSLHNIIKEGQRVDHVVRNMVSMFRHGAQEKTVIDLNSLIDDVLALAGRKLQASSIQMRTDFAGRPKVHGNPVQLQQVLMNLIVNAIEAMNERVGQDHVLRLRTETTGLPERVWITVQDSGPGIAAEHINSIFKPFFSTKSGGMGLGLAICKSIIDAHGGTLTAVASNRGTTFKVGLPLYKGRDS